MDIVNQVSSFATSEASVAWGLAGNFLVLIVLSLLLVVFAMRGHKGALISLIISLYAGYAIYLAFPYTDFVLSLGGTTLVKAILSVGMYVIASILPFHFIHRITGGGFGTLTLFPNLILSILTAAFLIALGYHSFDVSHIYTLSEPMRTLFAPLEYFFWWFIAPLIGLIIFVH